MTDTTISLIDITQIKQLKKPLLWPFHQEYRCLGFGYLFDGKYGYMGTTSHLWDWYSRTRNRGLSYFGLMMVWNCDGTGKSHIERKK